MFFVAHIHSEKAFELTKMIATNAAASVCANQVKSVFPGLAKRMCAFEFRFRFATLKTTKTRGLHTYIETEKKIRVLKKGSRPSEL
jgi:hypothetical protein